MGDIVKVIVGVILAVMGGYGLNSIFNMIFTGLKTESWIMVAGGTVIAYFLFGICLAIFIAGLVCIVIGVFD